MHRSIRSLVFSAACALSLNFCLSVCSPAQSQPGSTAAHAVNQTIPASAPPETVVIPGPLRSFLRMAGISQQVSPDEVMPMLARNVFLWGRENGRDTEYLVLLNRYVQLARELQSFAGSDGVIHIADCTEAGKLIQALGYQFEHGCGSGDSALMTANAELAFLTVDSGFPITVLEEDLQNHTPFSYTFPATQVPILLAEKDWMAVTAWKKPPANATLLDILLHDPMADRLYAALGHSDPETRAALIRSPGLRRLAFVADPLDFYGSQIRVRNGVVVVPGGEAAEHDWQELVGASPKSPGDFVLRLLARDRGWMAAYFDVLARIGPEQQAHLLAGQRLTQLYDAYRAPMLNQYAYSGVFPRNSQLLLCYMRLQWQPNGDLAVPGGLAIWKDIYARQSKNSAFHEVSKHARSIDSPESMLEELVAVSHVETDSGPLQMYLSLSAIDSGREPSRQLSDDAVKLLTNNFARFKNWYPIFSEFPALDDTSIAGFVDAASRVDKIQDAALHANALGAFQADIGLWQILARQGQIPAAALNPSWQGAIHPFTAVGSSEQLFDAARGSLGATLTAAAGTADLTQDQIIDLLAGPQQDTAAGRRVHQELARRIRSVLEDQRLVSLDTLYGLYDGLNRMAHGAPVGDTLIQLAGNLREFEMPRPIFTEGEKSSWSPLIYTSRHAELQVRTDLTSVIRTPGSAPQLEAARGRLTPFLRDTLVGLNYAYYEPPGAQVLHNNPLFVRSHDFATVSVEGFRQTWGEPELVGIGVTAGGGAYLMGSLADLPYALASVEEDFIAPENVQALIWKETVPQLLVGSVLPRWWSVTATEQHAAALYQRAGEEIIAASVDNPDLRQKIVAILSDRTATGRLEEVESAAHNPSGNASFASQFLPSTTFYLAAEYRRLYPGQAASWGSANRELDDLISKDPADAGPQRISRDFGVPHPSMEQSNSCSLVNAGLFPVSDGYTSRLFGESWESSNLYWARLADEMGYSPVMLNLLAPELTRQMVIKIFATNIDDWSALQRAMKETGDEFRSGRIVVQAVQAVQSANATAGQ